MCQRTMNNLSLLLLIIFSNIFLHVSASIEEEEHGVIYANKCEACKILALELQDRLSETGKSHDVIETGYNFCSIFSS